ncbi:hypothetical protein BGX27_005036 [Mortierella sp. AM989]|nr:hypothetical protein BGX27_005036 [Mortierella sp. AM989]
MDPEVPQGFNAEDESPSTPALLSSSPSPLPLVLESIGDQTASYGPEDLTGVAGQNVEIIQIRPRNGLWMFNGACLIAIMDKCPKLSTFDMTGFPFNHDQLIRQIANRLAPRPMAVTRSSRSLDVTDAVSDLISSTSALALARPTGLKRLALASQRHCRAKTKSIEYLLNHCTPDLEELLLINTCVSDEEAEDDDDNDDSDDSDDSDDHDDHDDVEDGLDGGGGNVETGENNMQSMGQENSETSSFDAVQRAERSWFVDEGQEWKLRRLVIEGDLDRPGPLIWLPLLQRCSLLQEICFNVFQNDTLEQLASTLRRCCPKISSITLQCIAGPQVDSHIADLIHSSQSLKRLTLLFFHGFGPLSTSALIKHSTTIEFLVLIECEGLNSKGIQAVLSSCTNLKTFRAMTWSGREPSSTVYLDVNDMVDSPWSCLHLENLQVLITRIARPDLRVNQYGAPLTGPLHDGTISGYALQRVVYEQLGKLTRLQELCLGHDKQTFGAEENYYTDEGTLRYIDADTQLECLEFSLESGLDILRDLKELRVLNIDTLVNRIGLLDIQWMTNQWPKLEKVIAAWTGEMERIPEQVLWLMVNRPDIEIPLVPGMVHDF